MNDKRILKDSIFKIGRVISVDGRLVKVRVDKAKNTSHLLYKGELLKNISVGGYVKIVKGFTKIIGKVKGENVIEDKYFSKKQYGSEKEKINRTLEIELLGFFENATFKRGIKELPLLDNECFLLENREFDEVHDFVDRNKDEPLLIGTLTNEKEQSINIGINSLFASHVGIFGNTGSGKSYTLAKIHSELFKKYGENQNFNKYANFLLLDFNGEYSGGNCITANKKVYNLSTKERPAAAGDRDRFPLKEGDLIDIELISILANATDKTQKPFISRTINFYKNIHDSEDAQNYFNNVLKRRIKDVLQMADKDKAYALIDYLRIIIDSEGSFDAENNLLNGIEWNNTNHHFMPSGNSRALTEQEMEATQLYTKANEYEFPSDILSKLIDFLYLQLVFDVFSDKAQNEHIAPAINKLKSKRNDIDKVLDTQTDDGELFDENNMIIVNLYDVNLEMKKTLPLLFAKKIYGDHKTKRKIETEDAKETLNIIIDEAHNILSKESVRETESWKDYRLETFEEIIKEGRKFGVFLTLASQRPYDISPTIISQLHNYFLHRLINNNDITAIERTISYLDKLSVESLSILPTGTCIVAGLLAQIPVVVDIGRIEPKDDEPDNRTPELVRNWQDQDQEEVA